MTLPESNRSFLVNRCFFVCTFFVLVMLSLTRSAMADGSTIDHVKFKKPIYDGRRLSMVQTKVPLGPAKAQPASGPNQIAEMNYLEFYYSPSYLGTISSLSFNDGPRDDSWYESVCRKMDITVIREDGTMFRVKGIPNGYHAAEDERCLIGRKLVLPYEVWIMRHTALFD